MPPSLTAAGLELDSWRDDDLDAYERMVHERDPRARRAPEIAYELLVAHHGRGHATAAAQAVVAAATTGRHRLWATVRAWNAPSFRVLDKIGFHRTDRVDVDDFGESVWCTLLLDGS